LATRSQDLRTPWVSLKLTGLWPREDSLAAGGNQEATQTPQEDGTYQDPVVKLHSRRILKDISQHGGEGEEVIWDPALPHFGEGIVHESSIQPRDKGTCGSRAEDETTEQAPAALQAAQLFNPA